MRGIPITHLPITTVSELLISLFCKISIYAKPQVAMDEKAFHFQHKNQESNIQFSMGNPLTPVLYWKLMIRNHIFD